MKKVRHTADFWYNDTAVNPSICWDSQRFAKVDMNGFFGTLKTDMGLFEKGGIL